MSLSPSTQGEGYRVKIITWWSTNSPFSEADIYSIKSKSFVRGISQQVVFKLKKFSLNCFKCFPTLSNFQQLQKAF